jgi:transaldolase
MKGKAKPEAHGGADEGHDRAKEPEDSYLCWLVREGGMTWWNDSAIPEEIAHSLSHCATGVTTNPVLAYKALLAGPPRHMIPEGLSETETEQRTEDLIKSIVRGAARLMDPVYRRTGGRHGHVCAQVNPALAGDANAMIAAARRYRLWAENILVKLPVTKEGLDAIEECVAEGISVVGTVSFTVSQALAVSARHAKGIQRARRSGRTPGRCFAVIMIGRLDDYLRDIIGSGATETDGTAIRHAGIAVVKRTYSLFSERKAETLLLVAALRGSYHVEHLTGARLVMSIHPQYKAVLLSGATPRVSGRICEPVDPAVIERLLTCAEFRRAYEPDGMTEEEFRGYGATVRTLDQFSREGWSLLRARVSGRN